VPNDTADPKFMGHHKINDIIEDWSKNIPDAVWWVLGAVSGFIAGRVIGRTVLKISEFQHSVAGAIIALCLLAGFLLLRKKYEQLAGLCLWLGTFSIGLLTLR
jgi:hypothetical protein